MIHAPDGCRSSGRRSPRGRAGRAAFLVACALGALGLLGAILPRALAGAGDLDLSFNQTGKFTHSSGSGVRTGATGVALQQDGKIVLPIQFDGPGFSSFTLMRLNADGSLDTSFGGGVVFPTLGDEPASALAVAIQKDGKVVAAGSVSVDHGTGSRMIVVRLNPNGTADTSFDGDGIAVADFGPGPGIYAEAASVAIQRDGKIVVAGRVRGLSADDDVALARFNPDGSPDASFDGDGKLTTDFGGDDYAAAVTIQKDGRIVAAGKDDTGDFLLCRYRADGSLDRSFGAGGKVTTDFGGLDACTALALQTDGKIVAAGYSEPFTTGEIGIALARYKQDGRLDRSFDRDGKLVTILGGDTEAGGVAFQKDGKLVVAGDVTVTGSPTAFLVARYSKNGRLDSSFNTGGFITTNFDGAIQSLARGVALQPDGRIVAAGFASSQVAVARYLRR